MEDLITQLQHQVKTLIKDCFDKDKALDTCLAFIDQDMRKAYHEGYQKGYDDCYEEIRGGKI